MAIGSGDLAKVHLEAMRVCFTEVRIGTSSPIFGRPLLQFMTPSFPLLTSVIKLCQLGLLDNREDQTLK